MKKIVIEVHMETDKCRRKAMKIAAAFQGVQSVSLEGEGRDKVVVSGDGIDAVCLTNKMRKKLCYATLISVVDANASNEEGGEEEQINYMENLPIAYGYANFPPPSCPPYHVIYDPYPNSCSIL